MRQPPVLIIAHPREAAAWAAALEARGLAVSTAASRKAAGQAGVSAPAAVVVSEKLPWAGALRVIRDLRKDPATRECPVVLVGVAPFSVTQRLRLGTSAPDVTAPKKASPEAVADATLEALRAGKQPPVELTPAQQAAQKYTRLANLLMMMGVIFTLSPNRGGSQPGFDRAWFSLLIPLGGLIADYTTGRVDGRKKRLSWQGWAAIALIAVMAVAVVRWPGFFRLG